MDGEKECGAVGMKKKTIVVVILENMRRETR